MRSRANVTLVSEDLAVVVPPNHNNLLYFVLRDAQNKAQSNRSPRFNRDSGMMMNLCCRTFGKLPDNLIYLLPGNLQSVF